MQRNTGGYRSKNACTTIPETKRAFLLFLAMTITLLTHRSLPQSSRRDKRFIELKLILLNEPYLLFSKGSAA
jgi:hypothetical protein